MPLVQEGRNFDKEERLECGTSPTSSPPTSSSTFQLHREPTDDTRGQFRSHNAGPAAAINSALAHGVDCSCVGSVMRVIPKKLQGSPVADPVNAHSRVQPQREQLRHVVLPDLSETLLRMTGQISDLDKMAVVAPRTSASRAHDLCPCHRFEVTELRQDIFPPDLGCRSAPAPLALKVHDPEGPDDRLAIMESGVTARGGARLLAASGKSSCLRLFCRPSGHNRSYRLP